MFISRYFAHACLRQSLTIRSIALLGVANLTDEAPPLMTSWRTSNEVEIVGQSAFYSQYDWLGRRFFVNLKMEF